MIYTTFWQVSDNRSELALNVFVHIVFSSGGSMAKKTSGL